MRSIEKLEKEIKENKNNQIPASPIVNYLKKMCRTNEEFSKLVESDNKKLSDCFKYIYEEVRKKLNNKNGWVDDQEVYNIAISYYKDENIESTEKENLDTKINIVSKSEKQITREEVQEKIYGNIKESKVVKLKEQKNETKNRELNENLKGQMSIFDL